MTELEAIQATLALLKWIFGGMGSVAVLLFGIWWKIESRQDQKIDNLADRNSRAHDLLHKRINCVKDELTTEMTEQHHQIRDRIERVMDEVRR